MAIGHRLGIVPRVVSTRVPIGRSGRSRVRELAERTGLAAVRRERTEGVRAFGKKPGGFAGKSGGGFGAGAGSGPRKPGGFAGKGGPFAKFADGKKPFRKPGPGKKAERPSGGDGGYRPTKRRPE